MGGQTAQLVELVLALTGENVQQLAPRIEHHAVADARVEVDEAKDLGAIVSVTDQWVGESTEIRFITRTRVRNSSLRHFRCSM